MKMGDRTKKFEELIESKVYLVRGDDEEILFCSKDDDDKEVCYEPSLYLEDHE